MDSAIKAAYEKFGFVTQQDFDVWDYNRRREKAQWDMVSSRNHARREGEQIGEEKKAIEIARKMKEMGDPIERIHAITSLPTETIEQM